jgi:hypothetical protein
MGKYDDISPERLREDLVAFAKAILRRDREGGILESPADLQRMLGDLRQKIFAYEVRASRFDQEPVDPTRPGTASNPQGDDSLIRLSLKVVREAMRRSEEMEKEWRGPPPDDDDDHD